MTDNEALYGELLELYEHAPCGYILTRGDGVITRVNETFLTWIGYRSEDVVSKKRFQDFLTVPGKIYYETHFAPLLNMQGNVGEVAFELKRATGEPLPVLVTAAQRQVNGSVDDAFRLNRMTIFNASDRRKYESELLNQKRQLEKLNEEKNELLGMAAHELRTPLGVIFNYSEFLEDELGLTLSQEHLDFISLIRTTSENLLNLINDILDVSQIDAGKLHLDLQPTNLEELVSRSVAINRKVAERKQIQMDFECHSALPVMLIDQSKMAQVLDNLLINATKFSHEHTLVIVRLTLEEGKAVITVIDQGIGIPDQDLEKIFKPFIRANRPTTAGEPSTGLGLSIVRRIIEGHGGRVTVDSRVGLGSTFRIELPAE